MGLHAEYGVASLHNKNERDKRPAQTFVFPWRRRVRPTRSGSTKYWFEYICTFAPGTCLQSRQDPAESSRAASVAAKFALVVMLCFAVDFARQAESRMRHKRFHSMEFERVWKTPADLRALQIRSEGRICISVLSNVFQRVSNRMGILHLRSYKYSMKNDSVAM